jgi:hypothetical protein
MVAPTAEARATLRGVGGAELVVVVMGHLPSNNTESLYEHDLPAVARTHTPDTPTE